MNMDEGRNTKQYRDLKRLPRRWFPLWKLDGYILREFLIKYSVLMLVFVILFILSDVYNDISDFLERKVSIRIIVFYLMCKLPGNVRFILPISMLLGCMWTMAAFGKNMEVTAMRASGVSLFRCGCPIFLVGLLVTGVNIYFNEAMIPASERKALEIYETFARGREVVQHVLLAYRSPDDKDKKSPVRHWLFKVYVSGNTQRDVAIKTVWLDVKDSEWSKQVITQLIGEPGTPGFNDRVHLIFRDQADKVLRRSDPAEIRAEMNKLLQGRKLDIYASTVEYVPETGGWIFRNGSFISYDRNDETPFEESRGTIAHHESLSFEKLEFSAKAIPETPIDIVNSVKEKDDLPTLEIWRLLHRNQNMPDRVRAIYETVFYYRLAFPWACFLAVFLGIPLATKNERTGSMLAIISAIVVIVVYIVIAQVFLVLGKGGYVNPALAGLMPTIGFIIYGVWRILCDRN